jgi:hypothetical protein
VSGLIPVEGLRLARLDAGEPSSVQRLAVIRGLAAGKVVEARSAAQGDNANLASFVPRTDDPDEALGAGMLARRQAPPSGATKYAAAPFGRP